MRIETDKNLTVKENCTYHSFGCFLYSFIQFILTNVILTVTFIFRGLLTVEIQIIGINIKRETKFSTAYIIVTNIYI